MGIHKNGMEWKNRENLGAFSGQTSKKCRLRFKRRALQIVILFLGLYPRLPMRHCAISSKGVFENDSETNPLSILLHSRVTLSVFLLLSRERIITANNCYTCIFKIFIQIKNDYEFIVFFFLFSFIYTIYMK